MEGRDFPSPWTFFVAGQSHAATCTGASWLLEHEVPLLIHRITESFRLEKPSKVLEANHSPSTAEPTTNPCPHGPHPHGF